MATLVTNAPPRPGTTRAARAASLLQRQGVLIALVLLILFGAWRYDNFLSAYNIASVLRFNSMFALVALGMTFVIMTGGIDLSVGSVAALGSVVAALLSPYGLVPGLAGGVAAGLLVAADGQHMAPKARVVEQHPARQVGQQQRHHRQRQAQQAA